MLLYRECRSHPLQAAPGVSYRGGVNQLFLCKSSNERGGQNDDVGGIAMAQLVGHGANRAELPGKIESCDRFEGWREVRDQTLCSTAARDSEAVHVERSIAAIRLSRVIGRLRTRTPRQSNTALAIAAVTGPSAASPAPTESISALWISSTST